MTDERTAEPGPDNPFGAWLIDAMARRRLKNNNVAAAMTARGLKMSQSMISGYRYGKLPERESSDKLAEFFGDDPATVWGLVRESRRLREEYEDQRSGRHKPGPGPTGDAEANTSALLQGIAEKVEAMYRAFDRGEMIGAWASPEPPTLDAELAVMTDVTPDDRSRLIPVSVADNREARELPLASVVWIDPGGEPHPGKVVLVQKAGVKRLKKYEPGDDVIGVGRLVQWTLP